MNYKLTWSFDEADLERVRGNDLDSVVEHIANRLKKDINSKILASLKEELRENFTVWWDGGDA